MQISLLALTLVLFLATVRADEAWSNKYTAAPTTPPSKKAVAPVPPPRASTPLPPPSRSGGGDDGAVSLWPPTTSWALPDFSRRYAEVSTEIAKTDDRVHRSIWGWLREYPLLQFSAIILLSVAIWAVARAWLRQCFARDTSTQHKRR